VREVVNAAGTVQQVTNYYPFGATYFDDSAVKASDYQPYKFNGKELDRMHGLDTYDYGARQHDPILARWDRIDPLCEKYYNISPYAYCANNPVRFVDPDGREIGLPEEIKFGISHPIITKRIGVGVTKGAVNISTNATRFATRGEILYGSISKIQEERGSENGAFRHTLWQAQITSEFGSDIAKQVGDAHEDNPNIDMSQTFFTNINDADKSVDLHNNIIGRAIGENNKGAKMDKNAKSVLNVYMKKGLYQAKKVKGGYKVERVKLDSSKGKQLMNILNQLDENGMYPSERSSESDNDNIRRYEALQNSLH
jgi:RHS repeat-associated protein